MLKVLIVDDEPKARRGVSKLIELYSERYELVGTCQSGEEAIGLISKRVPDVVVTDIRMPKQDGLELINYLKHRYHNLDFIILSGYGEFEYAKKALQYQVSDFLLKPLQAEELYFALDKIAEKRKNDHIENAKSLEDNYFFNLIKSGDKEEEKKNLKSLGLYDKKGTYRVGVLEVQKIDRSLLKQYGDLRYGLSTLLPKNSHIYVCFARQIIFILEEHMEKDILCKVLHDFKNRFLAEAYMGVSEVSDNFFEFKQKYFEALEAVKQYIYAEKEIFYYEEMTKDPFSFPSVLCEKLIHGVKSGDEKETEELLRGFLDLYREKRCGILRLKRDLLILGKKVEILVSSLGMDMKESNKIMSFLSNIEEVESFAQIEQALQERLYTIAVEAKELSKQRTSSYQMNRILSYIKENYTKDLSLTEVADYMNLSEKYLGNYFKTETGMNFVEYITKLRIEKAKELLLYTNEKIYQIAERVGYPNTQYFVTLFKKKIGVTPAEYRKNI